MLVNRKIGCVRRKVELLSECFSEEVWQAYKIADHHVKIPWAIPWILRRRNVLSTGGPESCFRIARIHFLECAYRNAMNADYLAACTCRLMSQKKRASAKEIKGHSFISLPTLCPL